MRCHSMAATPPRYAFGSIRSRPARSAIQGNGSGSVMNVAPIARRPMPGDGSISFSSRRPAIATPSAFTALRSPTTVTGSSSTVGSRHLYASTPSPHDAHSMPVPAVTLPTRPQTARPGESALRATGARSQRYFHSVVIAVRATRPLRVISQAPSFPPARAPRSVRAGSDGTGTVACPRGAAKRTPTHCRCPSRL